jgi:hypothetical protein
MGVAPLNPSYTDTTRYTTDHQERVRTPARHRYDTSHERKALGKTRRESLSIG